MECSTRKNCLIRFHRSYTPTVFYINPSVIYYEAVTQVFFNPRSTLNLIRNLQQDEMAFVNTEIGGSKLDFEFLVDYDDSFSGWNDN